MHHRQMQMGAANQIASTEDSNVSQNPSSNDNLINIQMMKKKRQIVRNIVVMTVRK